MPTPPPTTPIPMPAGAPPGRRTLPRTALGLLLALALARFLLHALLAGRYGFDRDELAFLSDARHLAWGYVAYPPVTSFLAHVSMQWFGDSLTAFRLPSALAQALATLLAGLMARELGGGRMAQAVAAIAVCCAPFSMVSGTMLSYSGLDYLWWVLAAWMLLKIANARDDGSDSRRWWLGLGLAIGLGMMTRYTMLVGAIGIVAGVLATPLRRHLATPWPWAGAALSLLVFAPNAWWQWRHGFVYLDFVQYIHARDIRMGQTAAFLPAQLSVGANPLTLPLWVAGLAWLALAKDAARGRALAWFYGTALLLYWLVDAREYYLAPAYPMLLAAGAACLEHGLARLPRRAAMLCRGATALVLAAAFVTTSLFALPLAAIGSPLWNATASVHPQFSDRIGWPELVAQVAGVYHALPEAERKRTAIYANNYGEAGAFERYGPRYGVPPAISQANSFWSRGYGDPPPTTVIVVGSDAAHIRETRATCVLAGRIRIPHGVDNDEGRRPDIYVCRDLRFDWARAWPRKFG
jgi:4-amino-4-deoxy-L-arabinose transferase-like glycosyltransferase